MLKIKVVSVALGLSAAVSFSICIVWGLLLPEALHMHGFLELILPGFKWLSWGTAILGIVESFLFGVYAGLVYVPIYNYCVRKFGQENDG